MPVTIDNQHATVQFPQGGAKQRVGFTHGLIVPSRKWLMACCRLSNDESPSIKATYPSRLRCSRASWICTKSTLLWLLRASSRSSMEAIWKHGSSQSKLSLSMSAMVEKQVL